MKIEQTADLLSLLPPYYRNIADYRAICNAEKAQFARLESGMQIVSQNFFIQTMDEDSVLRWEKLLHIQAHPTEETLEFRRSRVLSRLRTRPPFTLSFLYQKLNELLGTDSWLCEVDPRNCTLEIGAEAETQSHRNELLYLVNRIKPAHLAFRLFLYHNSSPLPLYGMSAVCGVCTTISAQLPKFEVKGVTS